tara:strand:- start:57 stop:263 length:207 start_codon:yes stop_codon:yes gene_type:complete
MSNFSRKDFKLEAQESREDISSKFNIKEVGYLLQLVEVGKHNGQALELALVCKIKLQNMLDKLMKHTE